MKKFALLCFLLHSAFIASADDISLGYCDGNNVSGELSGMSAVAIRLPQDEFPMYQGSRIIGVRIGLGANCDKGVNVFLRDRLDSTDLYTFKTGALYKGWCDVLFDEPVDYPVSDLVVGYEVVSGVRPGVSAVAGYTSSDGCLVLENGSWTDRTRQGVSPLCLQLLVAGDSYAVNDAALLTVKDIVAAAGMPLEITGNIRNNTNSILREVALSLETESGSRDGTAAVADVLPGEIGAFTFETEGIDGSGKKTCDLRIRSVAGMQDDYGFNDMCPINIRLVDGIVARKVLVEEFTGQNCPNCPSGKGRIDEALKGIDNVVMVAHHTGFGSDDYTASGSTMLHFFYNDPGGSTYAPAMMIDREAGNPGPVGTIGDPAAIRTRILERQRLPSEVSLTLMRDYDIQTRTLKIYANMRQVEGMDIGNSPVVCICLIENGIIGLQRPNYSDYRHDAVNRLFVTAPLGDPVALSVEDDVSVTYDVIVDETWNVDNMEIVAFVSNYDSANCNNCMVYNAESCALVGNDNIPGSGVGDIVAAERRISAIYSISGVLLNSMQPGVNIIRYTDGTVRKVVVR